MNKVIDTDLRNMKGFKEFLDTTDGVRVSGVFEIKHVSGKRYFGAVEDIAGRISQIASQQDIENDTEPSNKMFAKDFKKGGADAFEFKIIKIFEVYDKKEALTLKNELVDKHVAYYNLYGTDKFKKHIQSLYFISKWKQSKIAKYVGIGISTVSGIVSVDNKRNLCNPKRGRNTDEDSYKKKEVTDMAVIKLNGAGSVYEVKDGIINEYKIVDKRHCMVYFLENPLDGESIVLEDRVLIADNLFLNKEEAECSLNTTRLTEEIRKLKDIYPEELLRKVLFEEDK